MTTTRPPRYPQPPVRSPRRTRALVAAGIAAAVAVLGAVFYLTTYGPYGAGMRTRELVVHFTAATTAAQRLAARDACSTYPNASPEPIGPGRQKSTRLNSIRYRIDSADYRQIAALEACLGRQPGVRGFEIPETM